MLRLAVSLSFLLLLLHVFSYVESAHIRRPDVKKPICGYESCPASDSKKLNIHVVAHTHDDVGWVKTVDEYYFGREGSSRDAGVQHIIQNVVEELRNHPDRRFIYVETAFLWKWWQEQNEEAKEEFRSFINNGRLEIIGGGWSMNDEATTHYHSLIDQYTWGFRRLSDTLGECARPKIGWQIDPFGHSREQASMFAQMGFDGMFIGRLDYEDKSKRLSDKTAEFIWEGSPNLGNTADIFSVVLFNGYSPPPGFCFDVLCNDSPIDDDPQSPGNNIVDRVKSFLDYANTQARDYRTNNIILTMGNDFTYKVASMWYTNLDKLIRYTNEKHGSEVNVFYSTPSCYLKSLHDRNMSWTTKSDDFFPYASDPNAYWTGYYSSRPTLKFYERLGNNFLQIVKQLSVLTGLKSENVDLDNFREAMGVLQHHDAVAGTEKQYVAEDYAKILHKSMDGGAKIASEAMGKWIVKDKNTDPDTLPKFHTCTLLNISSCEFSEDSKNFVVTVYNPSSQMVSPYVRIPVQGKSYIVKDSTGTEQVTQHVPIPPSVLGMPGRNSKATSEMIFRANSIPALGYQSFYVSEKIGSLEDNGVEEDATISSIGGDLYNITVNELGKVVIEWKNKKSMKVEQSFYYYEGADAWNSGSAGRASGAYVFRPKNPDAYGVDYIGSYKFYKGPLVEEIHQTINEWISQVVRIYKFENRIEFDWLVGPIPTEDGIGKEIVTHYSSEIASDGLFYTDSNAREMLKRTKNYRPTWDVRLDDQVAGNYYPITSKIYLKDKKTGLKMSVLTDRAQGGSSLHDGELEIMVHRRLLRDDNLGVDEVLDEMAFGTGLVARGQHYLLVSDLENIDDSVLYEKKCALDFALRPWTLITPANDITFEEWSSKYNMKGDGLHKKLPSNVQILTLEPWKDNSILLRLEHIFEIDEAKSLSKPVEINIQDMFAPFTITSIRETTLGGNQWKEEMKRLKWNPETRDVRQYSSNGFTPVLLNERAANVLLKPMEIRTFIIQVSRA